MTNIGIILALLALPYFALMRAGISPSLRGRIGVSLVLTFAALGHFVKTAEMMQMLPAWVPMRMAIIYASGVFEAAAAVTLLLRPLSRLTAWTLCLYFLLILPSNVYAAIERVDFGGHSAGPAYLLIRVPLQLLLIAWTYWFGIRGAHSESR